MTYDKVFKLIIIGEGGGEKDELRKNFFHHPIIKEVSPKKKCPICMRNIEIPGFYNHFEAYMMERGGSLYTTAMDIKVSCPICYHSIELQRILSHVKKCVVANFGAYSNKGDDFKNRKKMNSMGVEFIIKDLPIEGLGILRFQVWDVFDETRRSFLLPTYIKGANGIMYLFSLTDKLTLTEFDELLPILRKYNPRVPIMLVGTNVHLKDQRQVQRDEAFEIARTRDCSAYVEISAKENINVEEIFVSMGKIIMDYSSYYY